MSYEYGHSKYRRCDQSNIGPARVPVEVPVTVERLADDVARLAGNTSIPREAAGLTWNWLGTLGRDATLHARLTLKR